MKSRSLMFFFSFKNKSIISSSIIIPFPFKIVHIAEQVLLWQTAKRNDT